MERHAQTACRSCSGVNDTRFVEPTADDMNAPATPPRSSGGSQPSLLPREVTALPSADGMATSTLLEDANIEVQAKKAECVASVAEAKTKFWCRHGCGMSFSKATNMYRHMRKRSCIKPWCNDACDQTEPVKTEPVAKEPVSELVLLEVNNTTVRTTQQPPCISVCDVLALAGHKDANGAYKALLKHHPDVKDLIQMYKFDSAAQRHSPVTDAIGLVAIMRRMPGLKAARFREEHAETLLRHLGADDALLEQIRHHIELSRRPSEGSRVFRPSVPGEHRAAAIDSPLTSVTGIIDIRSPQVYLRETDGRFADVHPVGRPNMIVEPELLKSFRILKLGSQGCTNRQKEHKRTFRDSRLLDSFLTPAHTLVESKVKDTLKNDRRLYEGLYAGKTVRDKELVLVKTQEEYEEIVAIIQSAMKAVNGAASTTSLEVEKAKLEAQARIADSESRARIAEAESQARIVEAQLELFRLKVLHGQSKDPPTILAATS